MVTFEHEQDPSFTGVVQHSRPRFSGVGEVWVEEDQRSSNDLVNFPDGGTSPFGSNIELGFDDRWDSLPGTFTDTTWYYRLDAGDTMSWNGFFDTAPGGTTLVTAPVTASTAGWWSVKLTVPAAIVPFAGHYLMDVTVTDSTDAVDPVKSARHYLLPGSLKAPPPLPEPAGSLYPPGDPRAASVGILYTVLDGRPSPVSH